MKWFYSGAFFVDLEKVVAITFDKEKKENKDVLLVRYYTDFASKAYVEGSYDLDSEVPLKNKLRKVLGAKSV